MSIVGLIFGVFGVLLGVALITDVPRRIFPDPTSQQKLADASLGGRIALGSIRVRVAYGIVCIVVGLLVIVAFS